MSDSSSVVHDNGDATVTTGVSGAVIGLAVVSVALRFYSRYYVKAALRWDDWLILISLVSTILTGVLVLWGTFISYFHSNVFDAWKG
jgi:hypothetical protein